MAYDKTKWHADGDFPPEIPPKNAGTHIGIFLAWCFRQGWAGASHLENHPEVVQRVIDGRMTGREFLETYCDGTFNDEDLNDEGNTFARTYYETEDYLEDYEKTFVRGKVPTIYHVVDPRADERMRVVLDKRRRQWERGASKRKAGEIELLASGTAEGVFDLRTRELIFTDPDFRFGPDTKRDDFVASDAGRGSTLEMDNAMWTTWKVGAPPRLGGVRMNVMVYFKGDKPHMLSMALNDEKTPENPWDPDYQQERNRLGNEWLTKVFGTAREFAWGTIQANYDPRSGTSGIYVRYE